MASRLASSSWVGRGDGCGVAVGLALGLTLGVGLGVGDVDSVGAGAVGCCSALTCCCRVLRAVLALW
ncbi:MAG TPA: hypothetical protein DIS77_02045 [Rothia sp.]|nr:hypothetical protein [Rothia sp. (in: high G+C Gram-positive bacteria)]